MRTLICIKNYTRPACKYHPIIKYKVGQKFEVNDYTEAERVEAEKRGELWAYEEYILGIEKYKSLDRENKLNQLLNI